ncbi:hypothetical protein [Clavibacter michiganensis]|uniref:hypothetical protein n=1 Tax=Clavibacter michiganensis TaxID=28447 RepID=UPI003EC02221
MQTVSSRRLLAAGCWLRAWRTPASDAAGQAAPGQADPTDPDHRLLLLTVDGIAAGLQNTR